MQKRDDDSGNERPSGGHGGFVPFGQKKPAAQEPLTPPAKTLERELQRASNAARPRRKASVFLRAARMLFVCLALAGAGGGWLGYKWLSELGVFEITDAQLDIIVQQKPLDNSEVFDRAGKKIGEYFDSYSVYVPFKELPKDLVNAVVAIEDRNFWVHKGFDPRGMLRATVAHVKGGIGSRQGASTLTQQLVRHFLLTNERSMARKVKEIALAIQLEKRLSKEKILELYVNSMFLGNGAYGVGAAARRYFGKEAQALLPHESALIAGLFQSPSRMNPTRNAKVAKSRQQQVLKAMYRAKFLTFQKAKDHFKEPLAYEEYVPMNASIAPYWVDYIKEEAKKTLAKLEQEKKLKVGGSGLRIYTTLDLRLQRLAEQSLADSSKLLDDARERTSPIKGKDGKVTQATVEASILSVDPRTGEILAMVGGRDYEKSKFNRTYQSLRSPGSSFKPVVYSLALMNKWKWSDVIFVSPITINNYRPHTPNDDMLTETTVMRSFYRSMNTPTVELGQKLGLKKVMEHARLLGIRAPIKEEFGSMLGSSDATMMDMARLYSVFANQGKLTELVSITKITDRAGKVVWAAPEVVERQKQVLTPQIAYLMTQGMRAVLAMGTGYTSAHLSGVAAGKTGTSNDSTDNWFCGYAPNLATIVWVGTDEHASIHGDTTGGKLALPIWDKFMTKAFTEVAKPQPFTAPSGVVWTSIHPKFGNRAEGGVKMFFLKGNEPAADASALEVLSQTTEGGYRDVFAH